MSRRLVPVLYSVLILTSCSRSSPEPAASAAPAGRGGAGAPVAVTTTAVVAKPMAVLVRAVGNVEASSSVDVRSQVTGELLSVGFSEGQEVAAGQLLFTIDPRAFDASVKQAQATLQKDIAQAKNADADLARYANLLSRGLVSQADYDVRAASAGAFQAAIAADTAAVENATLQLQNTRIKAPVSGRTGALLVHVGALVRAADATPLVVINQMSPVLVAFAVPARQLPRLRADQARGALAVEAQATDTPKPSRGTVTFVDNAIDPSTDTIRLKAIFPNGDRRLWPGQFVDVVVRMSVEPRAIVVPDAAVQPGQQGPFVYVVRADQTVEARPITVAWSEATETVVQSGVQPGETVVTDGQLRLTPGARVSVKTGPGQAKGSK
jgi:membrane fusion protein, multidrug efflux system